MSVVRPQDGRIAAVGRSAEIGRSAAARVVDLDGRVLASGFIDAHNHLAMYCILRRQVDCRVPLDGDLDGILGRLASAATVTATEPAGAWVRGWGFAPYRLRQRRRPLSMPGAFLAARRTVSGRATTMATHVGQVAGTALLMQPSPAVVAYAELLELPWAQLEARVGRELADNPALERTETSACLMCGGRSLLGARGTCWDCSGHGGPWEFGGWRDVRGCGVASDGWDVAAPTTAAGAEELLVDLRATLPRSEGPIAAYLVACLDQRGLLSMSPEEAAARLGVAVGRVLAVVAAMRRLGPPGLGARDVRELLLLQLDAWDADHEPVSLVRTVISGHLDGLAAGDLAGVAAATGSDVREVAAALEFIRGHLRPRAAIDLTGTGDPAAVLPPDVVIRPRPDLPGHFAVELVEPHRLGLSVRPIYRRLAAGGVPSTSDHVCGHAREQVRSATAFLSRLERRWQTLRAVAEHVVEVQREFLAGGPAHLVPLTRADVARELGLHESTVSRAVSGRHALLPTRKVVPLAQFVSPSMGPRETLRQLIRSESHPLSDGELAAQLAALGFPVARRTVAKYRGQLAIPSAGRRRRRP